MNEKEPPICVIEICKGFCCENISRIVMKNLVKLGLTFEQNGIDKEENKVWRCLSHDREKGVCKKYENRCWYCRNFFCESAERGFMRNALKCIENPTVNKSD